MKRKSLIGETFNRLKIIEQLPSDSRNKRQWLCLCSCGEQTTARTESLTSGHIKSCGCLRDEKSKARMTSHGLRNHSLYTTWLNMRDRCSNKNNKNWELYGGRGIIVCKEWDDFAVFLKDMGEKEDQNLTLERINGDGDYCKENCMWASWTKQARNTSMRSHNSSGITGVHFTSFIHKGYLNEYWVATWSTLDGKNSRKHFSLKKYSNEEALQLAISYRKSKIAELNSLGADYTERHGT